MSLDELKCDDSLLAVDVFNVHTHTRARTRANIHRQGECLCKPWLGVAVSNKNVSPINSQKSGPKECKKKEERKPTPHKQVPLALASSCIWFQEVEAGHVKWANVGKPVRCQWKAIALPSSSWYRKASDVMVVLWRCWLVQAIPRHQAQVSSKITLHACHDCTVATFKFQPFHTFQRSTNSPTSGFRSMQCCVRYIALSLTTPGAVSSSAVRLTSPRSSFVNWCFPSPFWRPLWPSTLNESSWALGIAERSKKKPHVQMLQFCSVRRIELQAET